MASKQLGKFKQWAGEKISSEKKTEATDEFKDLEVEVERRRFGMEQVYEHSRIYYRYLMKKRDSGDGGEEKLLPIESLGRVMVAHGEEFGPDSAYGHSLSALGNAHVKIATLQEQFGEKFHSMFLTRLELSLTEVAQYYVLRKKLKSRRLAYDAAVSQIQKPPKKEAERIAAEEELIRARQRFEEISTEVQTQMERIQDGEMDQFKDLGRLLDMELKFAESWVETLKEIKADWPDNNEVYRVTPNKPKGLTHVLQPTTPSQIPGDEEPEPSDASEGATRPARHQRSMSVATSGSPGRKSSVTNWASTAVGSIFKKEKTGNFEALDGDDRVESEGTLSRSQSRPEASTAPTLSRSRSARAAPPPPRSRAHSTLSEARSSKHGSPRLPPRNLPNTEKTSTPKLMRALYAFNGAQDELTMEAGDEIMVLSEPSDTWWVGECKSLKGLFPVNYTEEMPKKPPLPTRPAILAAKSGQSQPSSPVQDFPMLRARSNSANANKGPKPDWADEPFGDHHSALESIAHSPDYRQTAHSGGEDDEDDRRGLVTGTTAPVAVVRQLTRSFSAKKAPPPPPARRPTTSVHKMPPSNGTGSSNSPFLTPTTLSNKSWHDPAPKSGEPGRDYEESKSPFDEGEGVGSATFSGFSLSYKCRECSCDDFQQNLFKKDGFCNSCFHAHA